MSAMGLVTTLPGIDNTANLSLDFINQKYSINGVDKKFNEALTFSRSSTATYFGSDGLLKTAGVNTPRFEYDPVTKANRGFLAEESRTNLITYSDQLDNAAWTKFLATVTPNAAIAPDGTMTADKLVEDNTVGGHAVQKQFGAGIVGDKYTGSIFVKAAERSFVRVRTGRAATESVVVNLTTGALVSTGVQVSAPIVTSVGNGWWRISCPATLAETSSFQYLVVNAMQSGTVDNYQGDGVSGIYVWGGQVESGLFASSYIPTQPVFTGRTSTATYFDSTGVLKTAASGVARNGYGFTGAAWVPQGLVLEAATTNLLTYSEQFDNAAWAKAGGILVTPNATLAPDGTVSGDKIITLTGVATAASSVVQTVAKAASPNTYTASVYAKAGEMDIIRLFMYGANTTTTRCLANYNLTTGVTSSLSVGSDGFTSATLSMTPVGGGWWRCTMSTTTDSHTSVGIRFYPMHTTIVTGDSVSGLHVWGAQLEAGLPATSYVPSQVTFTSRASSATYTDAAGVLQTAATNVARSNAYSYDSTGTLRPVGLLLEAAATNLHLYSEQYDNAVYTRSAASVAVNAAASPNGAMTADKLVESNGTGAHYTDFIHNGTFATGDAYTFSVFVKPAGRTSVRLNLYYAIGAAGGANAIFNLTNKTVSPGGVPSTQGVVDVGNGWFRCWLSGVVDTPAETRLLTRIMLSDGGGTSGYQGDGTSGAYLWGAQLETGRVPTSYIQTVAATATRAADVSSSVAVTRAADTSTSATATRAKDAVSIETLDPWYNPSAGTLALNYTPLGPRLGSGFTASFSSGVNDYLGFCYQTTNPTGAIGNTYWRTGGSGLISTFLNANFFSRQKVVNAWSGTTLSFSANGATTGTSSSVSAIPAVTKFELGDRLGAYPTSNYFSSVQFYSRRLTDSMIQLMSST